MAFTVLYDTCALYPNTQRNLLIRLARTGLVRARWSVAILEELDRALEERAVTPEKRRRLFELMNAAYRTVLLKGSKHSSATSSCPMPTTGMCWRRPLRSAPR